MDVAPVLGDPTQLHQVLMNLCTNASHAMRNGGGVLEVRLDMAELTLLPSSVLQRIDGGRAVRLMVRDSGHGIDAATL
jgi:signal transduction histidine kinase